MNQQRLSSDEATTDLAQNGQAFQNSGYAGGGANGSFFSVMTGQVLASSAFNST
jgi:hypothetical protein